MTTLLVKKYPEFGTLARCIVDEGQEIPEGFERLTQVEFDEWVAAQPVPPTPVDRSNVPLKVTNAQFRIALIDAGIFPEQVDVEILSISDEKERAKARAWWDWANEIYRDNPLLNGMAYRFGITPSKLDELFIAAEKQ